MILVLIKARDTYPAFKCYASVHLLMSLWIANRGSFDTRFAMDAEVTGAKTGFSTCTCSMPQNSYESIM